MLKEYLSTLANKLRSVLETTEKINAQNFVDKIQEVYSKGQSYGYDIGYMTGAQAAYPQGKQEGIEQGKQECQNKHFVGTAISDGGPSISFKVPFKPDTFIISAINPLALATPAIWLSINGEMNNCLEIVGSLRVINDTASGLTGGNFYNTNLIQNTAYENGVFNYTERYYKYNFGKNVTYTLIAFKTGMTPKEYTIKHINDLPDASTGKVLEYNRTRINENFTTEEWESLIATKPNWTFSLV